MKLIATLALALPLMVGCATGPDLDMNKVAEQFYKQPRTYTPVQLTGVTTLTLTGTNMTILMQSQLEPLSIVPKDTGTAGIVANAIKDTALVGLGIVTAGSVMDTLAKQPQVVPAQVVNPVIVETGK